MKSILTTALLTMSCLTTHLRRRPRKPRFPLSFRLDRGYFQRAQMP